MASAVEKKLIKITKELLKKLEVKAEVAVNEAEDQGLKVLISGEDLGRLIGYRGRTLSSLQLVLGLMVNQGEELDWKRVVVDVGGWRESREESLKEMAERAVKKARDYREKVFLPPMSPTDRRVIHLALQEYADISSDSEGEGEDRRVVVKLKK